MSGTPTAIDKLSAFIRETSCSTLSKQCRLSEVTLSELEGHPRILGRRMSAIVISSEALKIILRAHFFMKDGETLTKAGLARMYTPSIPRQVHDFFKEYCNVIAGKIKAEFESHGLAVGLSLPISLRGLDQMFFPVADGLRSFADQWRLSYQDTSIAISVYFNIKDPRALEEGDFGNLTENQTGEMAFL